VKAVCWEGTRDVEVRDVPDPKVLNPRDAIVRVTSTAICGSDLHLYDGYVPTMKKGDVLGHEFMGEVVEVGSGVKMLAPGDRVVVPFAISCGACYYCMQGLYSACDNTNPNAGMAEKVTGYPGAGLFGYSHLYGGYAGGQAEYVRVPFADVGPLKVPAAIPDEQLLFLSDIFPTGWQAAEQCEIKPGDSVAIWGCGPVGQFAIRSALLLGAERVFAIDSVPERLKMAKSGGAEAIDEANLDVLDELDSKTGGRGPDACIDAVGMEAHDGMMAVYDRLKQAARLETDRPIALRQAIQACGKGGVVSIPGVYVGFVDKLPIGAAFAKGLTFKMGQTHVQRYMRMLLHRIEDGEIDPSFVVTHRLSLDEAPSAYEKFRKKEDGCIKVVMKPEQAPGRATAS
jgi:threonine dehydrogenase-like Zn-dependent dehydrogenase